jgi:hypothetical protein
MIRSACAALLLCTAPGALAQETRTLTPGAKPPPASVDQLSWLAGTWRGEGIGAPATEVYSSPQAGGILGHFLQEDGKGGVQFYEIIQIVPVDGSLAYRVRHFNPDLTGWEDKTGKAVEFRLVAIEGDAFYFDGLTLRRSGADAMTAWVRVHKKDGGTEEIAFRYRRGTP